MEEHFEQVVMSLVRDITVRSQLGRVVGTLEFDQVQAIYTKYFGCPGQLYNISANEAGEIIRWEVSAFSWHPTTQEERSLVGINLKELVNNTEFEKHIKTSVVLKDCTIIRWGTDMSCKDAVIVVPNDSEEEGITLMIVTGDPENVFELEKLVVPAKKISKKNTVFFAARYGSGLRNKPLTIKNCDGLDLGKNYNSDLPIEKIRDFVESDESGLFLFYGEPGTGKTSLIKYLISTTTCGTRFVILNEKLLLSITADNCLSYFMESRNTVFIIEDCEKLLVSRELSPGNDVLSILLDMTDGLLADALKLRFICTFNTSIRKIDSAVLRKGRLAGKYRFTELSLEKTRLHIPEATQGMTLAEIYNQQTNDFSPEKEKKPVGF